MDFQSFVSNVYDTYHSQSNKTFYAKILVGNKEFSFDKSRFVEEFLKMGIAIHNITIQDYIQKKTYQIESEHYTRHEIKEKEIFVRAHNRHFHISTVYPEKKTLKEKIKEYIFPQPKQNILYLPAHK